MIISIIKAALKIGLNPYLLIGLCSTESDFNPRFGDNGKSKGICQVKRIAAVQVGLSYLDLNNHYNNALVAGKYLQWQYKRYGSEYCMISAYNAGYCTEKNRRYYNKVKQRMKKWKRILKD